MPERLRRLHELFIRGRLGDAEIIQKDGQLIIRIGTDFLRIESNILKASVAPVGDPDVQDLADKFKGLRIIKSGDGEE